MLQDPLSPASPPPLTVMALFEQSVIRGPFPNAFAGLLRGAEALLRALPPDYRVEPELGPVRELQHYAALAWCISHFTDLHYREARGAAPSVPSGQRHPLDDFTYHLGLHLDGLRADGRAGNYQAHGLLESKQIDLEPRWFADGNVTRFDALNSAILFDDGRRITGIEGRWVGTSTLVEHEDSSEAVDDDDGGEMAGPPVVEAVAWIRTAEAEAWLDPKRPVLKKVSIINDVCAKLGITRAAARQAFDHAVPADRRRTRGGQRKK